MTPPPAPPTSSAGKTHSQFAVVDPHVDLVDEYIALAEAQGAPIVAVFDTHVQADDRHADQNQDEHGPYPGFRKRPRPTGQSPERTHVLRCPPAVAGHRRGQAPRHPLTVWRTLRAVERQFAALHSESRSRRTRCSGLPAA